MIQLSVFKYFIAHMKHIRKHTPSRNRLWIVPTYILILEVTRCMHQMSGIYIVHRTHMFQSENGFFKNTHIYSGR